MQTNIVRNVLGRGEQEIGGDFEMTQVLGELFVGVYQRRADSPLACERRLGLRNLGQLCCCFEGGAAGREQVQPCVDSQVKFCDGAARDELVVAYSS